MQDVPNMPGGMVGMMKVSCASGTRLWKNIFSTVIFLFYFTTETLVSSRQNLPILPRTTSTCWHTSCVVHVRAQ